MWKGKGVHPHLQQAGPEIPSWLNVLKKVVITSISYRDFHNLMGFTSKKMPNNIKMFVKKVSFLANFHSTSSKNYSYMHTMTIKFFYFAFCILVSKICRILRWFKICGNNWKKVHPEKLFVKNFCKLVVWKRKTPIYNFFVSKFFAFFSNSFETSIQYTLDGDSVQFV
jgi:hypothetical protein